MEEKLLVNRYNERLDVTCCRQWTSQRCSSCSRSGTKVCRVANLASRFILSLSVGMEQDLRKKQNGQSRQSESKHPEGTTSPLVVAGHLDTYTTPILRLTLDLLRGEQPFVLRHIGDDGS